MTVRARIGNDGARSPCRWHTSLDNAPTCDRTSPVTARRRDSRVERARFRVRGIQSQSFVPVCARRGGIAKGEAFSRQQRVRGRLGRVVLAPPAGRVAQKRAFELEGSAQVVVGRGKGTRVIEVNGGALDVDVDRRLPDALRLAPASCRDELLQ